MNDEKPETKSLPSSDLPPPSPAKRRPRKALMFSGILCWFSTFFSLGLFVWFWKTFQWPPDFRWPASIFAIMLISGMFIVGFAIKRILFGPDRFSAVVGLVVGLLPLLLWPYLFSDLYWRGTTRQNIERGWKTDPAAFLISNIADAEMKYRYPRRTAGDLVTLVDRGEPEDCSSLVKKMDEHIQSMCELLEGKLDRAIYWVRGELLGQKGVSLAGWAVCGDSNDPNELQYLDKHEVAHATIALLSPVEANPPSIMVEGWAEFNSTDRSRARQSLMQLFSEPDSVPSLDELVTEKWYGRSFGPAYSVGGPLVEYLIETHGGPKFFSLYKESRRGNFTETFRRIYGEDWSGVEPKLRAWLTSKHPDLQLEKPKSNSETNATRELLAGFALSPQVDQADWKQLSESLIQGYDARLKTENGSVVFQYSRKVAESEVDEVDAKPSSPVVVTRVLIDAKEAWLDVKSKLNDAANMAFVSTPTKAFRATRSSNQLERKGCLVESNVERKRIRDEVLANFRFNMLAGDPVYLLKSLSANYDEVKIEKLESGQERIILQAKAAKKTNGEDAVSQPPNETMVNLQIDPRQGNQIVVLDLTEQANGKVFTVHTKFVYVERDNLWNIKSKHETNKFSSGSVESQITTYAEMDLAQQRSLMDELHSIEVLPCENGEPMPSWLAGFQNVALGWTILAGIMIVLFGLLRL